MTKHLQKLLRKLLTHTPNARLQRWDLMRHSARHHVRQ